MTVLALIRSDQTLLELANKGDAQGIVDILNAKTIKKTDNTMYGPIELVHKMNPVLLDEAAVFFEGMAAKSATMRLLIQCFTSSGFDFSSPITVANLNILKANGMSQAAYDALVSIGTWYVSRSEEALGRLVTIEEINGILETLKRSDLYKLVTDRYNAAIGALDTNTLNSVDEVLAFLGAK